MSTKNPQNILWLSWRCIDHPEAGGAEQVQHQILKRLVKDGYSVIVLTSRPEGMTKTSKKHGYKIIRAGNRYTVYLHAWRYYRRKLKTWPNTIIEEVNTVPFFSKLYTRKRHRILFIHQLAREIWFHQYFPPLNVVGWLAEPVYQRFIAGDKVLTVSNSSKQDLMRHGHKAQNINIISEGLEIEPVESFGDKYDQPTLLAFGAVRPMKRTHLALEAFLLAKQSMPDLLLIIAGDDSDKYADDLRLLIAKSNYSADIQMLGRVSQKKKIELYQKSHLLLSTALKEGWGLTISEAASQGTPAIAYDVDGQRDSANCIVDTTPQAMAQKIVEILGDKHAYSHLQNLAHTKARGITFDQTYSDFCAVLD